MIHQAKFLVDQQLRAVEQKREESYDLTAAERFRKHQEAEQAADDWAKRIHEKIKNGEDWQEVEKG